MDKPIKIIQILIPVFNEENNIEPLYERIKTSLDPLVDKYSARVCFIDDFSNDTTTKKIINLQNTNANIQLIRFTRNFGHQAAISAGYSQLNADCYIIMDGDLQDPPEILPQLLEEWEKGFEVVHCLRKKRKEIIIKRFAYFLFYRVYNSITNTKIPLDTGDFCLMDKKIVVQLRKFKERNVFIRGLRSWIGYKQTSVTYERAKRNSGTPKYSFRKLLKLAYDGLYSFSFAPLRFYVNTGFIVSTFALVVSVLFVIQKLVFGIPLQGWTSLIVAILFLGGIQLLGIGILGEYIGRIFDEVKQRPNFIIDEENSAYSQGRNIE